MFKSPLQEITLFIILLGTYSAVYFVNWTITSRSMLVIEKHEIAWLGRLATNLLGYITVLLPLYLTYLYAKKTEYLNGNDEDDNYIKRIVRKFFISQKSENENVKTPKEKIEKEDDNSKSCIFQEVLILFFYFAGLQVSFGTSSYFQEKIMTQKYVSYGELQKENFKDSQFLVFMNRFFALWLSVLIICFTKQPKHYCAFYKYCLGSTSNLFASWTLYEALKYVNFPTQVLAKSCKPIPVMLMGKIVSKLTYKTYEYFTTSILLIGIVMFMISVGETNTKETTISGAFLLLIFVICDAFTTNWQGKLFKQYKMSSIQMMCGTNAFSFILTTTSLLQQNSFYNSFLFVCKYPAFALDCVLLSVFSAVGQIFILSTIKKFGPLTFSIFSTIRQGMSILLSCIIFKHQINIIGAFGIATVFFGILLRMCISYRKRRKANQVKKNSPI